MLLQGAAAAKNLEVLPDESCLGDGWVCVVGDEAEGTGCGEHRDLCWRI